jgi:hypothetical protein
MTMIPGAMEPRRPSSAAGNPAAPADRVYARVPTARPSEAKVQRRELPGWLRVSIFAAVLIAAMWLVMSVF